MAWSKDLVSQSVRVLTVSPAEKVSKAEKALKAEKAGIEVKSRLSRAWPRQYADTVLKWEHS